MRTRATQPGQLSRLSVSLDGTQLEFRAVSPVGKHMVTRVYSRATARNARRFLQAVIEDLPFPLHSVQVDGGSEFEQACQTRLFMDGRTPAVPAPRYRAFLFRAQSRSASAPGPGRCY